MSKNNFNVLTEKLDKVKLLQAKLTLFYKYAAEHCDEEQLLCRVRDIQERIKEVVENEGVANAIIRDAYSDATEALGMGRLDNMSELNYVMTKEEIDNAILEKFNK